MSSSALAPKDLFFWFQLPFQMQRTPNRWKNVNLKVHVYDKTVHTELSCDLQRGVCHLTHWGRVPHICVSEIIIIGSDNGLSPGRRQAIIWTNAGILLIWPLGTNFREILIEIDIFSCKKMHFKLSSGKWRPFCLGLNVLTRWCRLLCIPSFQI